MRADNRRAIALALAAALFYALNVPCSKLLLGHVPPTFMAAFLYLGAGLGVGGLYLFHRRAERPEERLSREDLPYTVGMVVLDIIAPILLMTGVSLGSSSNASLLGNFEIAATTVLALVLFHERVSKRLWAAVGLIPPAMLLGFVAYGLSIFTYVRAQKDLGAARTSAYYAAAPFLGALLSFLLLGEALSAHYLTALGIMAAGTALVVRDTLSGGD